LTILIICTLFLSSAAARADELTVLPEKIDGVSPADMMKAYLNGKAAVMIEKWKIEYEKLKTAEDIAQYQKQKRDLFINSIGGLPQRTPLNVRVVGEIKRQGYRVEKILYESEPNYYTSAWLFLPDNCEYKPPYPGVIMPCGHMARGKAFGDYQKACALMALNGLAVLIYDPIDQGERIYNSQIFKGYDGWGSPNGHMLVGVGSILLGRNTARFEIWNGIRALDYLQSRDDIDGDRLGCTGNSGGGTLTAYLMALDERVKAAAPSCYLTTWKSILRNGPQDAEHNTFRQIADGRFYSDYAIMAAPRAVLICCSTQDYVDVSGTWEIFRYGKRIYSRLGVSDNINLDENDDRHGYFQPVREAVTRWMMRWLRRVDKPVREPPIEILAGEESCCAPGGMIMNIKGSKSPYDLNRDYEKELSKRRREMWAAEPQDKMLERVRQLCGIRKTEELPEPVVDQVDTIERNGCTINKMIIKPEEGIYLPALMFVPKGVSAKSTVLYLNESGKAAGAGEDGPIERLMSEGKVVLAVDIRGIGETMPAGKAWAKYVGSDGHDFFRAYLIGRSYVGMRAEDILICGRFISKETDLPVELVAVGNVGVPTLHAAALEPQLFCSVKLVAALINWRNIIQSDGSLNQLINTVHGALTVYDLDDLRETIVEKLTLVHPSNAMGRRID